VLNLLVQFSTVLGMAQFFLSVMVLFCPGVVSDLTFQMFATESVLLTSVIIFCKALGIIL
jgi:hypothetical protein